MVVTALAVAVGVWLVAAPLFARDTSAPRVRVGTDLPATVMNETASRANNSPMLRADPTDARFVTLANRVDTPDYVCSLQLSGDGGRTWSPADPVPTLPKGVEKCFGGEVAFDGSGKLYFLFIGLAGPGNEPVGAFLTTSADRGRTFSRPHRVLGPLNFGVRMALDPTFGGQGRIHLVWLHSTSDPSGGFGPPPNPILAAHSDDGGATFSSPVQVSDRRRQRVVAPTIAIGGDRLLHAAYYDLGEDARDYQGLEGPVWDGKWSLVVATSRNGGRTFERGSVAEPGVVPHSRVMAVYIMPPAALAARGSRVCVAWADARNGDPDVLARCSNDAGRRWNSPERLNDDRMGNGRWQYLPGLGISPGGRIDAIFYDRRNDIQNVNNDIFYTSSTDGGRTYRRNVKLNRDGASLSVVGARYTLRSAEGQWDLGSRMALLSRKDEVVAAWPDTRNSFPFGSDQDIFTARISVQRDPESWRSTGVGAALVAGGLGMLAATRLRRRRGAP